MSFRARGGVADPPVGADAPDGPARRISHYLGGGAATTVGATAVGPSMKTLREHPDVVDEPPRRAVPPTAGPSTRTQDVDLCRELGVSWVATNHPGRTELAGVLARNSEDGV